MAGVASGRMHAPRQVGYGHLGDSNLHLNVSVPKPRDDVIAEIEPFVLQWTGEREGACGCSWCCSYPTPCCYHCVHCVHCV